MSKEEWKYYTVDNTLIWFVPDVIDSLLEAGLEATPGQVEDVLRARGVNVSLSPDSEGVYHFFYDSNTGVQ